MAPRSSWLYSSLHFFIYLVSCSALQNCDSGWFGSKCQFKCHCNLNVACDATAGECPNHSKCALGWFGKSCQHQDLVSQPQVTITSSPAQPSYTWLTDRDDTTCNSDANLEKVIVAWPLATPFTWLRISSRDTDNLGNVTVSFGRTLTIANCMDQKVYAINNNTIDIRCHVVVDTTSVVIEGHVVKSLCSLYISGGRNVALKQTAAQSSTVYDSASISIASNAVDGNTNGTFASNTCTHTNDTHPNWNVTFGHLQVVNRIVLYNRLDSGCFNGCPSRLNKFTLETYNANKTVFHFQDNSTNLNTAIFNVTVTETESSIPVIGITINLNKSLSTVLTLCEVEAYGECVPGSWDLYCDKPCNAVCSSTCNVDTGACQIPCKTGTWGQKCEKMCNTSCWENSCNRETGLCDRGCNGFSDFPICHRECISTHWGPNCTKTCSSSCQSTCDTITGVCNVGCNGFSDPPLCTKECDPGRWGANCTRNCSSSCLNSSCDRITGVCDLGCLRYLDPPHCTNICGKGKWGLNCSKKCKLNCWNQSCNRLTGVCDLGCNGYTDFPDCSMECNTAYWGPNCTRQCNVKCLNSSCDKVNGSCNLGCNGFSDPPDCTKNRKECLIRQHS